MVDDFPVLSLKNFRFNPGGQFEPAPFIRWIKYRDPKIVEDKVAQSVSNLAQKPVPIVKRNEVVIADRIIKQTKDSSNKEQFLLQRL